MTRAFDLALHQATNMFRRRSSNLPKITIGIDFNQSSIPMAGGGGLSSIQKRMNIGGEPHRLSYINSDEASLLKQLGGSGRPVRGVPAYYMGDEPGSTGFGEAATDDPGDIGYDLGGPSPTTESDVGGTIDFGGGLEGWTNQQKADAAASQAFADVGDTIDFGGGYRGWTTKQKADAAKFDLEEELNEAAKLKKYFQIIMKEEEEEKQQKFMSREDWEKLSEEERSKPIDTREPSTGQKIAAGIAAFIAGTFGTAVSRSPTFGFSLGRDVYGGITSLRGPSDLMSDADREDINQMGMRDWDPDQFEDPEDPEDYGSEDPDKRITKKEKEEEEEKKAKKLRGMLAYFKKMRGVSPGYTDEEIELWKSIYPPDHPFWETINREREPIWPIIEEETAVV